MKLKHMFLSVIGAAVLAAPFTVPAPAAAEESLYLPNLVYRTGPFAPGGIPIANGFADYWNMINERDGGVRGVKVVTEECEFGYNTDRGVECYERTKNNHNGALVYHPISTGVTYAIADRSPKDKIPVISMGYGRSDAGDGTVFPYVFPLVATYWGQATALIKYIGDQEGGMDALKGQKIALVYLDIAYGKEPIPFLEVMAKKYGFELQTYPVSFPGIEQKATWLRIRRAKPDYVLMWGWGVMNQAAIKEAANINFPRDKFIGNWWSGAEQDTVPAGAAAKGYKSAALNESGTDFPVIQDIMTNVYAKGNGTNEKNVGQVLYNRSLAMQILTHEAILTAMDKFGDGPITSEQLRWGIENLNMTEDRAKAHGALGIVPIVKVSCENHIGVGGGVKIQQWNGSSWEIVSDWIKPINEIIAPEVKKSAAKYLADSGISRTACE
ncbi:MAG: ABC transporter permease [Sneathiella sp.]|nr:MAG: ABC transporter permease [Sneathiella sp.]